MAQDDLSFDATQYLNYHTYTNTFSKQQQTCCDPAKSAHLLLFILFKTHKEDFSFSSRVEQCGLSLSP
jgi:hypothetical protein